MSLGKVIWLRLNEGDLNRLDKLAEDDGRKRSQMIRVIVRKELDKHDTEYNKNKRRVNEDD
jgi:metal-responsive CopG/Arc/MetJ family transcriptional regulator